MRRATLLPHAPAPDREMIPRGLLRAMLALVLSALAITVYATLSGRPPSSMPPESPAAQQRSLVLVSDGVSGAVTVLHPDGSLIAELAPEEGGFVAGIARVIARQRSLARTEPGAPVTLSRGTNGRLAITDPATGWRADLMGFGADNARSFARLLDQP